jgi:hypothetical protein
MIQIQKLQYKYKGKLMIQIQKLQYKYKGKNKRTKINRTETPVKLGMRLFWKGKADVYCLQETNEI